MRQFPISGTIGLMVLFLTKLPLWASGLLLVGVPTFVAMLAPGLIRRRVSLTRLSSNNEVAGFKFAVVGVLYAVAVAFAVLVVWEKFSEAEMTTAQEAAAAATVYRLSLALPSRAGAPIRHSLSSYVESAIEQDWPKMENAGGGNSRASSDALDALYAATLEFQPADSRGNSVQRSILGQIEIITASRTVRGVLSTGIMPTIVWWVLFGGAMVTITFQFFFATENLRAQTLMAGMLAALIFASLLIIVAVDYPFSGPVRIEPHALELLRAEWQSPVLTPPAPTPPAPTPPARKAG